MKRKPLPPPPTRVPADPSRWSDSSKGSVAAHFTTEYTDQAYRCRHCREPAVFTAVEQKDTYEVRKANINQQRTLCTPCWHASHRVADQLEAHAAAWNASKSAKALLAKDRTFLSAWLALLQLHDTYVGSRRDRARINMLRKLLAKADTVAA